MTNNEKRDGLTRTWDTLISLLNYIIELSFEVVASIWKGQIPEIIFSIHTITICFIFRLRLDETIFKFIHHPEFILKGKLRILISTLLALLPWFAWAARQIALRKKLNAKLHFVFESMRATSGMGLSPTFVFDLPIDSQTRKLRLWANALALDGLKQNKSKIEDGLGLTISKINWADENKKMLDIVYSYGSLPDFYVPEQLFRFKNFEFPIGKTTSGELSTGLKQVPHYLVAGETGTGKSTFIRMLIEILLMNNRDIEIYFLDFKGGIEAESIADDPRFHVVTSYEEAMKTISDINASLDTRAKELAGVARDIDSFNNKQKDPEKKYKRFLVVVDEVSEIFPKFKTPNKNEMTMISHGINRIARLGRALGIHLIIGTQKPDAKNLDPTIKANLGGILCFAVSHPTQSMVVLGDGRASDLNAEIKGRAIWKHGSFTAEVQTPFIDDNEINEARKRSNQYWGVKEFKPSVIKNKTPETEASGGKAVLLMQNNKSKAPEVIDHEKL